MNFEVDMKWLYDWYYNHCDGDWEHNSDIKIGTICNPGWYLKIAINQTDLLNKSFEKIFIEHSEHDWFCCEIQDGIFRGFCGPFNLPNVLSVFRQWAE